MKRYLGTLKLFIGLVAFTITKCFAEADSSLINHAGFYNHLIRTGEYEALFNLTQAGIDQHYTGKSLVYHHALAALQLGKYECILKDDTYWLQSDTSELHFNFLVLESIAAIKLKKDSIACNKLNQLGNNLRNGRQDELVFILNIYDTVVRQKKELSNSSAYKISNLTLLTTEDAKDVLKSIEGIEHPKNKSALMAGLLSAVIPGAGKWYAGYFGTPFAALIINAVLGGVALELGLKQGWTSWPALASYAAFSAFYAGNIIGTVYSVNIKKKENEAFYKGVLLYHLMSALERYDASR